MKKILSLIAMLVLLPCAALADIIWTNPASGYWTNAANWTTGTYPGQTMTNNATVTNGVPLVILDQTPPYYVPVLTLSNSTGTTELRMTNDISSGTADMTFGKNTRIVLTPGSKWATPPLQGNKVFSGTNVSITVGTNAVWEVYDTYWGPNTVGGDYRISGGGTIDFQGGIIVVGYSNTAGYATTIAPQLSFGNTVVFDGMKLRRTYIHDGVNSRGNTLILTNTSVADPLTVGGVSYRAGGSGQSSSNTLIMTGSGTYIDTQGCYCYCPSGAGTGCVWRIENGASLTNSLAMTYSVNIPNAANNIFNSFIITNGGRAFGGTWSVGAQTAGHNNLLAVSGTNSLLDQTSSTGIYVWNMVVGATVTTGNVLRVSDGATLKGTAILTVYTNNVLDFTKGRIQAYSMTYYPTNQYVLGSNCTFAVENGTWFFNGGLLVDSNATLRGRGVVGGGGITVTNGGTLIGSMEGTLNVTNLTLAGGANYICKILEMGSRAGSGRGLVVVSTQLTFVAASPNYTISIDSDGVPVSDFVPTENYVLKMFDAGLLTGYDPTKITLYTNRLVLPSPSLAPWVVTNFANKIFVTYTASPETDTANGQVWNTSSNGNWSVAGNWTNNAAPTSGVGVILEIGGVGTNRLRITNDVVGTFDLNEILLTSGSTGTNVISGNPIRFNGADGGIYKSSGGNTVISNSLSFVSNAVFWGTEALEGSVTVATNFTVAGDMRKTGKWTLIMQGSNVVSGNLVLNSRGGGGIQIDSNGHLLTQNAYVSNGVLTRISAAAYTFGGGPVPLNYMLTGPGSEYVSVGAVTIGSNAVFSVTNGAQVRASSSITVNGSGSLANPFDISGGGEVYTLADSHIGNANNNNRVTISSGGFWDFGTTVIAGSGRSFYLGANATNNVLTLDGGTVRNALSVWIGNTFGAAGGSYNGILLTNSSTLHLTGQSGGRFVVGGGVGASYNWVDVKRNAKVISNLVLGQHYIGAGPNSTGNWVRVDGGTIKLISDSNGAGMNLGYDNGVAGSHSMANHLDIINGGWVQVSRPGGSSAHLIVGRSNGSCSNYVYVSGVGSTYNSCTERLYVGGFSGQTGNYVRVESGGLIDNTDYIFVGSSDQTTGFDHVGNYLSVSNGTLYSGIGAGPTYVAGSFRGSNNYIEVIGTNALWHNPAPLYIAGAYQAAASNNVDNYVKVDGATVHHVTNIRIGSGTNDNRNYLTMTNGASFDSTGPVYIGYKPGCHSNWIAVTGSTWDLGSSALTVGTNAACVGNRLIVGSGGYVARVETLTVSSNNFLTMSGGTIASRNTVISGTLEGQGTIGTLVFGLYGTTRFGTGAVLKPTAAFNMTDISLPTNMVVDASGLSGLVLFNYVGTATGATDLSGWTVTGGPAGATAFLDTTLKQVYLIPPKWILRTPRGKVLIRNNKVFIHR